MTKKALALRDGADHEEAVAGELGLIEFATAPGASPDELAWQLQRRYLLRELLALAPVAALVQGLIPAGVARDLALTYTVLIWPVVLLYGTWQPMRSQRSWSLRPVADLCFLGGSGMLGLAAGLTAGVTVGWVLQELLGAALGLAANKAALVTIPAGLLVGLQVLVRTVSSSLVERELEELPADQIPEPDALAEASAQVTRARQVTSVARASFRASGLGLMALAPIGLVLAAGLSGSSILVTGAATWALLLVLLGGQYLVRSLFYLGLAREGLRQLVSRREATTSGSGAATLARVAWRELRRSGPLGSLVGLGALAVGLGSPWFLEALGGFPLVFAVAALVPLVSLGAAPRVGTPARRMLAGAVAVLPAAAFLFGFLGLCRQGSLLPSLLGPGVLLLFPVALERAAWLWARVTRRLIQGAEMPPGPSPEGLDLARRACVLGAALGFPALALTYFLPWDLRELARAAYAAAAAVGPVVALLAAMRMHLAIAEGSAPPALPAEAPEEVAPA